MGLKLLFFTLMAVSVLFVSTSMRAADPAADELVGRVLANTQSRGVIIRARLVVADASSGGSSVAQLRIKGRRDGNLTRRLYQVLWPVQRLGQALYIERTDDGIVSGFLFEPPDKVTPLAPAALAHPYLDSDLSIEDLAEDFWRWPAQTISGEEAVDGEICKIVDSHPAPDEATVYALIRSWVSPKKALPLRIEKFDREAHLVKRFVFRNLIRVDQIWAPRTMIVQRPGGNQETRLEISHGDRDVDIPPPEFSLEAIKEFPRRAAQEAEEAKLSRHGSPAHK